MAKRGGQPRRGGLAALALVGVWIAAYWLWPADDAVDHAPITFDNVRIAPAGDSAPTSIRPAPGSPSPGDNPSDKPNTKPAALDPALAGAQPLRFTQHTIDAGETMQTIAKRAYGDESLWTAIAKANPLTDPAALRVGMTLRIPIDPSDIQGLPAPRKPAAPAKPRFPLEYVVQEGDSLSVVAKRFYGRSSLYGRIFDANRALLRTPDELKPGMRLLIPPPPEPGR